MFDVQTTMKHEEGNMNIIHISPRLHLDSALQQCGAIYNATVNMCYLSCGSLVMPGILDGTTLVS